MNIQTFYQQSLVFLYLLVLLLMGLLPFWSALGIIPNFASMLIYSWTIYRPDLTYYRLFVILGIVRDGLFGYPLGMGIFEIVLIVSITNMLRRYILNRSYTIIYMGYIIFIFLSNLFIWLLLSLFKETVLPFHVVLYSTIFNTLTFPLFGYLSIPLQNKVDSLQHPHH